MLEIRPARAEDKDEVLAFCQGTFQWGDYVQYVYDDWLSSKDGDLTVATVDGKPVALSHVAYLSPEEAWFEGLRVDPEFRRHGIAKAIGEYNRERTVSRGIKVGRALISSDNLASQTLSARMGFTKVLDYQGWKIEKPEFRSIEPYTVRKAVGEDMPRLLQFMKEYDGSLIGWDWHVQQVSEYALKKALQDKALWVVELEEEVCCLSSVTFWPDDKDLDVMSYYSAKLKHVEALVQFFVNEHLLGHVAVLHVLLNSMQEPVSLGELGFERSAEALSGVWELEVGG
ncbi:MAG: GNAT family N-acetyltransferase [Bacillota bacterium]|nr:GNAT family N-acetyltransferase [Bacillota bacterium]